MMKYKDCEETGRKSESQFISDYCSFYGVIAYKCKADMYCDITEHWDVWTHPHAKIDIKSRRFLKRGGEYADGYIFEIKNVNGDIGWGYGRAECIAYEREDCWHIVLLKELQKLVARNNYQIHNRKHYDRDDEFVWIPAHHVQPIIYDLIQKTTLNHNL